MDDMARVPGQNVFADILGSLMSSISLNPLLWSFLRDCVEWPWITVAPAVREAARIPDVRWIDYGCGDGQYARYFQPGMYVGLDISEDRISLAQKRYPAHHFQAIGKRGRLPAGYNGAMLVQLLHHMDDQDVRALGARLRESLDPPARILVVDPWPPHMPWISRLNRFFCHIETGKWHRSPEEVSELLGLKPAPLHETGRPGLWCGYWFLTTLEKRR